MYSMFQHITMLNLLKFLWQFRVKGFLIVQGDSHLFPCIRRFHQEPSSVGHCHHKVKGSDQLVLLKLKEPLTAPLLSSACRVSAFLACANRKQFSPPLGSGALSSLGDAQATNWKMWQTVQLSSLPKGPAPWRWGKKKGEAYKLCRCSNWARN